MKTILHYFKVIIVLFLILPTITGCLKTDKKSVTMIDFTDLNQEQINEWCTTNDMICNISYDNSSTIKKDKVISQSVDAGKKIDEKSYVSIVISEGVKNISVIIPSFKGKMKTEIENWCQDNNIKCRATYEYSHEVEKGNLISQNVKSGTKIKNGDSIDLVYSLGKEQFTFDSTFTFCGFEITFLDTISWEKIGNRYSEYHGEEIFAVPIKVKNTNNAEGKINMFYYSIYSPDGEELETVESYFDETLAYDSSLKKGEEGTFFLPILYDGDGEYIIKFDNYKVSFEVVLPIKK